MDKPVENWWRLRLTDLKTELEANNFEVHLADNGAAARLLAQRAAQTLVSTFGTRRLEFISLVESTHF